MKFSDLLTTGTSGALRVNGDQIDLSIEKVGTDYLVRARRQGDGRVVGQAVFTTKDGSHFFSDDTHVDPKYRRHGIASRMYDLARRKVRLVRSTQLTSAGKKFADAYFDRPV